MRGVYSENSFRNMRRYLPATLHSTPPDHTELLPKQSQPRYACGINHGAAANQVMFATFLLFSKEGIRGVPNISIFWFKRSGLMQKACFLSTSNRPARAARFPDPFSVCFVQINYVKATNRATLHELPGFVFATDTAAHFLLPAR